MGAGTTSDAPTTVCICAAICYWLQRIDFVLCGIRKVESKKDRCNAQNAVICSDRPQHCQWYIYGVSLYDVSQV